MSQNDVVALQANFDTWKNKRFPNPPKGLDVFEYYCVETFTRAFDISDSQLKTGMVGGSMDGGVDAFYIFANGELVDQEFEITVKDPPEFKLWLV